MIDFFSMGGYAVYVWPSFVLTAIVMFANFYLALRRRKKVIAPFKNIPQCIQNENKNSYSLV